MSLVRCVAGAMLLRPSASWSRVPFSPATSSGIDDLSFSAMRQYPGRPFSAGNRARNGPFHRRYLVTCTKSNWRLRADNNDNTEGTQQQQQHLAPEPMANLYLEWSLMDDKFLWEHRDESLAFLAERLGRGLRGVKARLAKLKDVDSAAYDRLFANKTKSSNDLLEGSSKEKLVPVSEVLRRVQWDYHLLPSDFSVLYYDRVQDAVKESPMDGPNTSVKGNAKSLVDALPEHRIVAVKYKERVVWDRDRRLDLFFAGGGIEEVMETYDEWKRNNDANHAWLRQRQTEVAIRFRQILGLQRYEGFKTMSNDLQAMLDDPSVSAKAEAEEYVQSSLELFQQAQEDPSTSLQPNSIPKNDLEALDCLSELVALSPSGRLRPLVLHEISIVIQRLEGQSPVALPVENLALPELNEDDLTETFVRGTGPGGQKINKTNNKVMLVHNPTKLRVECQDTRSLQQNRKIARKRLQQKLDEFLHGNQSRTSIKAEKAATKKAKAKARSRARHRRKTMTNQADSDDDSKEDDADDDW